MPTHTRPDPEAWDSKTEAMFAHYSEKQVDALASEPALESPASPIVDAIHAALAPESPDSVKARLFPCLREEEGLWDGPAHQVKPRTATQRAADEAAELKNEGYAIRPFRTNPNDA